MISNSMRLARKYISSLYTDILASFSSYSAIIGKTTVEQICSELHVSKSQLTREFKK